ncbi:kinesin-domain-containing protein [Wallemia mellicola]|nr:kinesin-domain-containing protein [Wallemia mellicola]TIC36200.1 kinesin-domain-containing protein [Wallemia mellicola]
MERRSSRLPLKRKAPSTSTTTTTTTTSQQKSRIAAPARQRNAENKVLKTSNSTSSKPKPVDDNVQKYWEEKLSNLKDVVDNEVNKINEMDTMRQRMQQIEAEQIESRKRQATTDELNAAKASHIEEISTMKHEHKARETELEDELHNLHKIQKALEEELNMEKAHSKKLKTELAKFTNNSMALETDVRKIKEALSNAEHRLEMAKEKGASREDEMASMITKQAEMENELRAGESLRKKLHNTIQELKGNVRVFARVRPKLDRDHTAEVANFVYPDGMNRDGGKQITLQSSTLNAEGKSRDQSYNFSFDRVFGPQSLQEEVFGEIEQLTQSVLDGYNVCIFAYGQTGSGKSWTMEGGSHKGIDAGMIPRAIYHIFDTTRKLEDQGWSFKLHGQFLEIYNENIIDLLGSGEQEKKHNITHEKSGSTTVSDVVVVPLSEPSHVHNLLRKANKKRTTASTRVHEQSSRSSSVFSLKLEGSNEVTGEHCKSVLNLVDLAGSERLDSTGTLNDPTRLKETQAINKSLSSLSDVISALGSGSHVPYRNSKLTYLLQNSLNNNSKTLMFLNLSPMQDHLQESLCSLRFALKVHSTHIGQAKRSMVVKN